MIQGELAESSIALRESEMEEPWAATCVASSLTPEAIEQYERKLAKWKDSHSPTVDPKLQNSHDALAAVAEPVSWAAYDATFKALVEQAAYEYEKEAWTAWPTGYRRESDGALFASATPLADLYRVAASGDLVRLLAGDYKKTLFLSVNRPDGPAVRFRGPVDLTAHFAQDVAVGSTDSIGFKDFVDDILIERVSGTIDDRAAWKTMKKGTRNLSLVVARLIGMGNGAYDPTWVPKSKWCVHTYGGKDIVLIGVVAERTIEHFIYGHNNEGDWTIKRCVGRHLGRTFAQFRNVPGDGPPAVGDVLFEDCFAEDVCLEQGGGGSAFSFNGGAPNSTFALVRCKVRLGCDRALATTFRPNVTGGLVAYDGEDGHGYGPNGRVILKDCDFEVGSVYGGYGSARRANVKTGDPKRPNVPAVGYLEIDGGRFVQGPSAVQTAWQLYGLSEFKVKNNPVVVGKIDYKGQPFPTLAAFLAAHPECVG